MENTDKIKFGTVVVVGRPNTGKSTLINTLMNQKVAITSPLPQTTRKPAKVLYEGEKGKFILTDTPGIFNKVADLVGKKINTQINGPINEADVLICLVDLSRPKNDEENKVIGLVRKSNAKKILVFNKIDIAYPGNDHLPEYLYIEDEFDTTIKTSALKGTHLKGLLEKIFEFLPETSVESANELISHLGLDVGPKIPMSSEEYVSELIREKAYLSLRQEVPYTVQVVVDSIEDKKTILVVKARILTTADRYKRMIIGENGRKIKHIGYTARKEMELLSGKKVFIDLQVETDRHWMERVEL